jgi:hypothetical protein
MRIHNIYSDEDGETRFRGINIEMSQVGPDGTTSKRLPATGVYFRTTPGRLVFRLAPGNAAPIRHQLGCAKPNYG